MRVVPAGIAVLLVAAMAATDVPPAGKASRVIPRVDVVRAVKTLRLKENEPVVEADRIRTGAGGRTRILLNDGSILNIGSSSEMVVRSLQEPSRASTLELHYGRLRGVVTSRTGSGSFHIRTATAVCGVLGTTIFVDASRNLTRVANLSDEATARVRVTSANAGVTQEVVLAPGEGTAVPANRAPQPPRRWTREEMQAAYNDTNLP